MSNRLNQEREQKLQPVRVEFAKQQLNNIGIQLIYETDSRIDFMFKGAKVEFYPYSGWATGKSIKDGRGLDKLLQQLV